MYIEKRRRCCCDAITSCRGVSSSFMLLPTTNVWSDLSEVNSR